jgi:hypothetical protein
VVDVTEIQRSPPPLGSSVALVSATVGLLATALASVGAAGPSALGVLLVVLGLSRASRRLVTLGGVALFVGVLVAGVRGGGPELLLVAALGTVLAWDVGEHAIGIGEQLGRDADSSRAVLVHAATTLLVGAFGAAVCYAAFLVVGGGQPVSALVFLLLGAVALVAALRGADESTARVRRER